MDTVSYGRPNRSDIVVNWIRAHYVRLRREANGWVISEA